MYVISSLHSMEIYSCHGLSKSAFKPHFLAFICVHFWLFGTIKSYLIRLEQFLFALYSWMYR